MGTGTMKFFPIASFLLVIGWPAQSQTLWLKIHRNFFYKDLKLACTTVGQEPISSVAFYFLADAQNESIRSAMIRRSPPRLSESIVLSIDELKDIEIFQDKNKKLWLKNLPLSNRLLKALLLSQAHDPDLATPCVPRKTELAIEPKEVIYHFDTSHLVEGSNQSKTEMVKFVGSHSEGTFIVRQELIQRQAGKWRCSARGPFDPHGEHVAYGLRQSEAHYAALDLCVSFHGPGCSGLGCKPVE